MLSRISVVVVTPISAVMSAYSSSSSTAGVDLLAPGDSVFQPIRQSGARLLDAGLQPLEQVRFLFYGAK